MTPKPLDILRKDLKSLRSKLHKIAAKKDYMLAQLADKKSITSSGLDNDANLVMMKNVFSKLWKRHLITRGVFKDWMTEGHRDKAERIGW
jgi:hypothetical protein